MNFTNNVYTHLFKMCFLFTLITPYGLVFANDICGDGIVGPTEECDDGNSRAGDGCDACVLSSEVEFIDIPAGSYLRGNNDSSKTRPPKPTTFPLTFVIGKINLL